MRLRPGMYIGDVKDSGMLNLLAALIGYGLGWAGNNASDVAIVFEDNNRFRLRCSCHKPVMQPEEVLPVAMQQGLMNWEFLFAGSCSTQFVFSDTDTGETLLEMQHGEITQMKINALNCCGFELYFKADPAIFPELQLDYDFYGNRFQEMAYLNPHTTITFKDNRKLRHDYRTFHYPDGIKKYLEQFQQTISSHNYPVHYFEAGEADALYRFTFSVRYWSDALPLQKSFVNYLQVYENGSLVEGFFSAFLKALRNYADTHPTDESYKFTRKNLKQQLALIACFSGDEKDVNFEGPTKRKLASPVLHKTAENYALPLLTEWLEAHPQEADLLLSMNAMEDPE